MQIGFGTLLTVAFIVLKLTGVIDWSWLWVLSPLWISFAIWLVLVIVAIVSQERAAERRRQAMRDRFNTYRRR
jgi:membrane protein implicated in regulation of membrane protease activity